MNNCPNCPNCHQDKVTEADDILCRDCEQGMIKHVGPEVLELMKLAYKAILSGRLSVTDYLNQERVVH